jgi:flavin-dependent dehydrogenase
VATWQLPLAVTPWSRRSFDGAVLAGDAGAFVDPLTGEGIHFAVGTGMTAAEVVDGALGAGRVDAAMLGAYDRACQREIGRLVRRSYRLHRWVACVPPVLESLFVLANAGPWAVRSWLNRVSTDFVVQA